MGLVTSIENVLSRKSKVQFIPTVSRIPVLSLDCSISEKHSRESPVSEHEIENGQTIGDHQVIRQFQLHIQGLITDTPLTHLGGLVTTGLAAALPNPGVLKSATPGLALLPVIADAASGDPLARPSAQAYNQLLQLQASRIPLNVLTSLYFYKNMFIKSISVPRDAKTGRVLVFDMDLVQLLLVSPQTVNITKFADPNTAAGQADKGNQQANSAAKFFRAGHDDTFGVAKDIGVVK